MAKATKPCDVEQFYDHHPTTATLSLLLGGQLLGPRGIRSLKMSIKPLYRYITGKVCSRIVPRLADSFSRLKHVLRERNKNRNLLNSSNPVKNLSRTM